MHKINEEKTAEENNLAIGDVLDSLLKSSDNIDIGRVDDIRLEWQDDGTIKMTYLLMGPLAFAGRIGAPLRKLVRFLLKDRFETAIPLEDVEEFGPTLRLRKKAVEYTTGNSERWIASHILRWIPGSGYGQETNERNTDDNGATESSAYHQGWEEDWSRH